MRVQWNGDNTANNTTDKAGIHFVKGQFSEVPEAQRATFAADGAYTIEGASPANGGRTDGRSGPTDDAIRGKK